MNEIRTTPAGPAGTRGPWRRRGVAGAVVVVVGMVAAGAFALTNAGDQTHFATAGDASPSAASGSTTAPTTASAGASNAAAAKPAVCANVEGAAVMADGMVMAPVPTRAPDPADQRAGQKLVASVSAGIARYSDLSAAVAAGYVPATNPNGYVVHYANWSVVQAGDVLDASRPSSLVYANTVSGPLLLGAMFLGPAPCQPGPDVAGPLTQWHAHANLCLSATHEVVGKANASGQCAVGNHNTNTYFMMHVWTAASLAKSYQFAAHVPTAAYAAIIRSGRP